MPTSAGGRLIESLIARDFAEMAECFEEDATMRALLPSGPADFAGAGQIVAAFQRWFGAAKGFEVVETTLEEVGDRVRVSWRLRVHPTPRGAEGWHVVEQQVFLRAGARIESLDLLCTGFMAVQPGRTGERAN
ncbi:MAG: hypothetical protein QOE63_124 [Acidimicrobiaceae bacterium]